MDELVQDYQVVCNIIDGIENKGKHLAGLINLVHNFHNKHRFDWVYEKEHETNILSFILMKKVDALNERLARAENKIL